MTTSYRKEAAAKLKAEKKVLREQEAAANKAKLEAEGKAHQENMDRLAKKLARLSGDAVVEEKPVKKKAVKKPVKKAVKKSVAKKKSKAKK
tara:strand:- start:2072 stop:2344 length:273 start_codon:yes stop_codon:yes gene_type:complete